MIYLICFAVVLGLIILMVFISKDLKNIIKYGILAVILALIFCYALWDFSQETPKDPFHRKVYQV